MQRESSSNPAEKWLNIAKSLINKGADVNATDDWKQTPLHLVDSVEMADLFIKHSANVNALDNNGRTPLHTVSNTEVTQLLVNSGADMQVKDVQGKMPIFQHLEKSHAEIVRILIDNGADVNSKNEIIRHIKSTEAADKNQNEMRKIIQNCAPTTVDSLKRAIESMGLETIKLMVNNQNVKPKVRSRCLCVAAKHGKVKIVEYFVKSRADVNSQYEGKNVLEWAISGGCMKVMETLINAGADINVKDKNGRTLLFQYVVESNTEIVQFLIEKGANVNVKDRNGKAPIHYARNKEIMKILINAGADVNAEDKYGRTPLIQSVRESNTEIVQFLVDEGADVNSRDVYCNMPLHYARSREITEILLGKGVKINVVGEYERTLLFVCVEKSLIEMVKFLVEKAANVNARDRGGSTPIHYANDRETMRILINASADINAKNYIEKTTSLIQHVKASNAEVAQFLVDKGADVNAKDVNGKAPIHYANDEEIMEILINAGADVNAKDEYGRILLIQSVIKSNADMVQFLVDKGADVNAKDANGNTSIHCTNSKKIMKILIDAKADIDAKNRDGETPLIHHVKESNTEIVQFLVDKRADINARNKDGNPLIRHAKNKEIMEILINAGANVNTEDEYGRTLLTQYVAESNADMVQFLVDKGADVNARDKDGKAPIHHTQEKEIMEILVGVDSDLNAKDEYRKSLLIQFVIESNAEMVQFLVDKGVDANARDKDGYAPIHFITEKEVAKILINAGADVDAKDPYGTTCLIQNIRKLNTEIVQFLIDNGADVNFKDSNENTPIFCTHKKEILEVLINAGADINAKGKYGRTPLIQSVSESRKEMTQYLVDKRADVNAVDKDGKAPIHHTDDKEIMKILINAGANVNAKDRNGTTSLIRCVKDSNTEMVQFLVDKGADVSAKDKHEHTSIYYTDNEEIIEILINAGADINAKNQYGETFLIQYIRNSNAEMVQFLVDKRADVNARDNDGNAPIHYANDKEIMEILINAGANVNTEDEYGRTLLIQYVAKSNADMVQFLVDKGADINAIDKDEYTSIHYANDKEIMRILINAGADVNVEKNSEETPQIRRTSESQKLLLQSPEDKGADEVARDIDPSVRVHHTESTEIAGSNSGRSTSANIKHESSVSAIEILPLISEAPPLTTEIMLLAIEISTVVGIIDEKHQHAQRCKTQCRMLAKNIKNIHQSLKEFYATLKDRRDKDEDLKESLRKFLVIIQDAQIMISKHCNVSFLGKVFLKNKFEDDFNQINKRLEIAENEFDNVVNIKINIEVTKPAAIRAIEDVKNASEEANKGVEAAIEDVQMAKKTEVLEIPTIKDDDIVLDEQSGSTSKTTGMLYKQSKSTSKTKGMLKKFQPIELIDNKEIVGDKQKLEIMWKLSSCEGILTLYGLYEYKDKLYMVIERPNVDCSTLNLIIKRRKFFRNWGVIRSMSLQLANAIEFMHRCEILHKAICSSNICIVSDRYVRIFGFEFARYISSGTNNLMGPHDQVRWTAPERLQKPKPDYDKKCDIYSLGVVMWSLATHEVPFDKLTPREIPDAVLEVPEDIPKEFAVIIEGCIDRDREKRWSIDRVNDELSKLVPENLRSDS